MDSIGWFIATLHQLIGHDAAATTIGATTGSKDDCLMCQYELDPNDERRRQVVRALAPTSIGQSDTELNADSKAIDLSERTED